MTTAQEAIDALANKTPGAIAAYLAERGVKGYRGAPGDCAIARYLTVATGTNYTAGLMLARPMGTTWQDLDSSLADNVVRLPQNVRAFIRGFDVGMYPALVALVGVY